MYILLYVCSYIGNNKIYLHMNNYAASTQLESAIRIKLDFGKPTKFSQRAYSILLAQLMATLVHYTYRVPLPGLIDWCALLERVFADTVNLWLRQLDPWSMLFERHRCEIHPSNRVTSINTIQKCLGLWLAVLRPIAGPNPNGGFSPLLAFHPPLPLPPTNLQHVISDITVVLKKVAQNPAVLPS